MAPRWRLRLGVARGAAGGATARSAARERWNDYARAGTRAGLRAQSPDPGERRARGACGGCPRGRAHLSVQSDPRSRGRVPGRRERAHLRPRDRPLAGDRDRRPARQAGGDSERRRRGGTRGVHPIAPGAGIPSDIGLCGGVARPRDRGTRRVRARGRSGARDLRAASTGCWRRHADRPQRHARRGGSRGTPRGTGLCRRSGGPGVAGRSRGTPGGGASGRGRKAPGRLAGASCAGGARTPRARAAKRPARAEIRGRGGDRQNSPRALVGDSEPGDRLGNRPRGRSRRPRHRAGRPGDPALPAQPGRHRHRSRRGRRS